MAESYYQGSNRGSIRSSDFHSSNTSAASPVSARYALLSASSINALVTDRELFSTAASVVPKLRALLEHRRDVGRSSTWRPSATGRHLPPHWVVRKKQYGAEFSEFDRTKLPSARSIHGPNWRQRTTQSPDIRHSMIEPRTSLYAHDAFLGNPTHCEVQQWPLNDCNVSYAVTAQVTLSCRLDEAMTMLFSHDMLQFDASMSALFGGRKYKHGDLLVSREFRKSLHTVLATDYGESYSAWDDEDLSDLSQPGWIALQSVVLRSRRSLNPVAAAKRGSRRQRLCFAAYSQLSSTANEAFYVMKTLQKPTHDQFVRRRGEHVAHQALRDGVDNIAAGYHLTGSYSDLSGHQTRVVMTAYVTTPSSLEPSKLPQQRSRFWTMGHPAPPASSSRRNFVAAATNAEAKYVVNLLAVATLSFAQLVRRRRLGYQTILHMPSQATVQEHKCSICQKNFGLLRPERFCQLCANTVCRECSRKFDVEPVARKVRRNRICFNCVANVDASVFQQEGPLMNTPLTLDVAESARTENGNENEAGSRAGVKISTAFYDVLVNDGDIQHSAKEAKSTRHTREYESFMQRLDRRSSAATTSASLSSAPGRQLADALFSGDPLVRARALEIVRQVVQHVTSDSAPTSSSSASPYSASLPVLHPQHPNKKTVDKYLEARLHLSSISLCGDSSADSSKNVQRRRSSSLYSHQDAAPRLSRPSAAPRQWTASTSMETELDLDEDLDSAALDAICEVAAMRMRCSIAYIVALNGAHSTQPQRVVGACGASRSWAESTVCPFPLVASGKPFVIRDTAKDAQLCRLRIVRDIGVRFFSGFPIKSPDGAVVACLCTVDACAREKISLEDLAAMHALSKLASDLFEEEVNPYTPRSHA